MRRYEYEPITANEYAFRLIQLQPGSKQKVKIKIIHALLDEESIMEYEAVSYVWGSSELCACVIVQNSKDSESETTSASHEESTSDRRLMVTNSLELVLRDLRDPHESKFLWIDGICINQNDQNDQQLAEKNHQVRLMSKIYSRAKRVLLHLGRPTDTTSLLKRTIDELQNHPTVQRKTENERPRDHEQGHENPQHLPEKERLLDREQELERKLEEIEELEALPETTDSKEQWQRKVQELQELQERLRETEGQPEPSKVLNPRGPESSRSEISDALWEQVSRNLAKDYDPFHENYDSFHENYNRLHERIIRSLEDALAQPWFKRVWIVQEVANSREALIYWGDKSLSVRWFVDLTRKLGIHMDAHQEAILSMMPRNRREKLLLSSGQDLYDLLTRFRGAQASRDHDKIFALLGMCKNGKGLGTITIDYSESLDCLIRDTIANIAYCDKIDVPVEFTAMDRFTTRISSLIDDLIMDFAFSSKMVSLRSLLFHRENEIIISPRVILDIVDSRVDKEIVRLLLDHRPKTIIVPAEALERAYIRGDSELAELLLTRCEKKYPVFTKWTRATISSTDDTAKAHSRLTQLGRAVITGEIDDVRQLLEEGANIEAGDSFGQTVLALAVRYGRDGIVKDLLQRGANIETKDNDGRTPLSVAASGGFHDILSLGCSERGKQIAEGNIGTWWRATKAEGDFSAGVIYGAAQIDEVYADLFQLLLEKGAEINSADNATRTPLWWAVNYGHESVVEKLIERAANTETSTGDRMSLISWAIWNDYSGIVTQLLANNVLSFSPRDDPLEWAIRAGNNSVLEALLDRRGFTLATQNFNDESVRKEFIEMFDMPLPSADVVNSLFRAVAEERNAAALQILLQRNLLPEGTDLKSRLLTLAVSAGCEECVEILVKAGGNVNYKLLYETPLWQAVVEGNQKMVQLLINNGSDPNISNWDKDTPLLCAARMGYTSIAQVLIENKADMNTIHYLGKTALGEAAEKGHQDVVQLLLDKGAKVDARVSLERLLR